MPHDARFEFVGVEYNWVTPSNFPLEEREREREREGGRERDCTRNNVWREPVQ